MRTVKNINLNWKFSKDNVTFEDINLPHTWNNMDGQDGGADYLRQKCYYVKELDLVKSDKKIFIEFNGVNHLSNVYFNDEYLGEHRGGFSTFRYDITNLVNDVNTLKVEVDNSEGLHIYPQQADFTFFGGIYRDVNIIEVNETHFDLSYYGGPGVNVLATLEGNNAKIDLSSYVINGEEANVEYKLLDKENNEVLNSVVKVSEKSNATLNLENPILWKGIKDPYLYTLIANIIKNDIIVDTKTVKFGIRKFEVCPQKGFLLNGESYPLRGTCRHQDRLDMGWAINKEQHLQDIELIKEVGANTIRLAHYQHDQYFYDLCDEYGFVVWAEIPFITIFDGNPLAVENTKEQMRELVIQNYNHTSIMCWGISNEITISGESEELLANQKDLQVIIKELDPSRYTTLANVAFVEMDSTQNDVTDILAWNHYFGWYGGKLEDNENWFDEYHAKYPNKAVGISEYGAEGITTLHTENPEMRDYTEEYHAVYHEHMLNVFETRPYIWGTYQWNMFDFAADARDEGGVAGRNNKGLVSFGRDLKKDAFYLYKAYWNKEEIFTHVCGRRFYDRSNETTTIKVYSNEKAITLFINEQEISTIEGKYIFEFKDVKLKPGINTVKAIGENSNDTISLNKTDTPNESYVLPAEEAPISENGEGAKNWFEDLAKEADTTLTFNEGYYSIEDSLNELLSNDEVKEIFFTMMASSGNSGVKLNEGMLKMIGGMKFKVIIKMAGNKMPDNIDIIINSKLQKIKKS